MPTPSRPYQRKRSLLTGALIEAAAGEGVQAVGDGGGAAANQTDDSYVDTPEVCVTDNR